MKIKRALLSVYDKTGIVDFARALVDEFGIEILSTGGTAKLLRKSDIPVTLVEDITDWGEMLDGRVKTLHPKIHAAILADRDNPAHMRQLEDANIKPIDMVVVNLYPFEETVADPDCKFEDAIEMIDIGGPCMLRAAAKNHKHVLPVADTEDFETVLTSLKQLKLKPDSKAEALLHTRLAMRVFDLTCDYDVDIHGFLASTLGESDQMESDQLESDDIFEDDPSGEGIITGWLFSDALRYGENPHQKARLMTGDIDTVDETAVRAKQSAQEIPLSYNNLVDADAAIELCKELTCEHPDQHVCLFVKHTNPCGVGLADTAEGAYQKAYTGDANAAMGGVLACGFPVCGDLARKVMDSLAVWGKDAGSEAFFIEVWVAPSFDDEAKNVIRTAKRWGTRVRCISATMNEPSQPHGRNLRTIHNGALVQQKDNVGLNEDQWKIVSKREPTTKELNDLRLAWLACKHTKSNAISICKDGMLIGNGAGQMSRVMSCRIATWLARDNSHAEKLPGAVAASDAFFPFRDGPDMLIEAGVTAIIQPGGSKRDAETIAACDERDIAMIFTGTRHFKH